MVSAKDVLWFLYLYPVRFLGWALPVNLIRLLARPAEALFQYIRRQRRRDAEEQICLAVGLERPSAWVRETARRFVANFAVRAIDDLTLDKLAASGRLACAEIRGEEHLRHAMASGKGAVVVSGHFYANRVAKRYLASIGCPLMSVRNDKPRDVLMGRLGQKFLQPRYIRFLHGVIGDEVFITDREMSLKIFRRLRSGGLVNVHIDVPLSRDRIRLSFLGQHRFFPAGVLEIIRLSGCLVIPMLCLGNSRHLTIRFDAPVDLAQAGSREEFAAANLPRLVSNLESQILAHPDQWELWRRL